MISPRFQEYKIPLNVHLNLQADINVGKKHTMLFRQLVKAVIPDITIWAARTGDLMDKEFPIIQACRGIKFTHITILVLKSSQF